MHYYGDINDYISHHGILGQRWGTKNGPPYPLGSDDHSASEKKAGWRKSLSGNNAVRYRGKTNYTVIDKFKENREANKYVKDAKNKGVSEKEIAKHVRESAAKSDKSEITSEALWLALGVATMNPVLISQVLARGGMAAGSTIKEKKSEERKKNLEVDAKTGFHKKDREYTPEEDTKAVNPGVWNYDANTKNNCVLCTYAYDLRRRGYDVTANKTTVGYNRDELKEFYPKAKLESGYMPTEKKDEQFSYLRASIGTNKELAKTTLDKIKKQGNGARGALYVTFDSPYAGHAVAYEVIDNDVVIRDTQIGRTYANGRGILTESPEKFLRSCSTSEFARLDNVDFNIKKMKEAAS